MNCDYAEKEGLAARYLLDVLPDSEREEFERHYFTCARCFQLAEETEDALLTRYALGDVTEDERERFERHFLPGAARQEQLAAKRALIAAIRESARRKPAAVQSPAVPRAVAMTRASVRTWRLTAALAIVLLGSLAAFFAARNFQTRRELRSTQQRLAESERAMRKQQRPIEAAGASATPSATPSNNQVTAVNPRKRRPPSGRDAALAAAIVNPPFAQLFPTQRSERAGIEKDEIKTITLPKRSATIIFYLEYEAADPQRSYRLALLNAREKRIWQSNNVRPHDHNAFVIALSARLLKADELVFQLSEEQDGQPVLRASYRFGVTRH